MSSDELISQHYKNKPKRYNIPKEIEESVNLNLTGFSLTDEGKVNTATLLDMYSDCEKWLEIINGLPEKVINDSGLIDVFKNYNEQYSPEDVLTFLEKCLSDKYTFQLNFSFRNSEEFFVCSVIRDVINDAIAYLEKNDKYGYLIRSVFEVRYKNHEIDANNRRYVLAKLLDRQKDIEPITYYKYLKYTISKVNDYIYSDKNPKSHYINKLVFDCCTKENKENAKYKRYR